MYAKRKIVLLSTQPDLGLRQRLQRPGLKAAERKALLKDVHLVEAAIVADRIVASLDDEARRLFDVDELNMIVWVNPVADNEHCLTWLAKGANPVVRWQLGRSG